MGGQTRVGQELLPASSESLQRRLDQIQTRLASRIVSPGLSLSAGSDPWLDTRDSCPLLHGAFENPAPGGSDVLQDFLTAGLTEAYLDQSV